MEQENNNIDKQDNNAPSEDSIDDRASRNWYVIHTYAGAEEDVCHTIQRIFKLRGIIDQINEIFVPKERIIEIKRGIKKEVSRMIFPGYVLVQIDNLTHELILELRSISNVTGFVSAGIKPGEIPPPLPREEVKSLLERAKLEPVKPKVQFDIGSMVSIMSGPFADFVGVVDEIDIERGKLKIMVDIFGRKTSVELNFDQVEAHTAK